MGSDATARRSRASYLRMLVLLAVFLLLQAPAVVEAQEPTEALGLEVVTNYGAISTPARWQPVEVALEPLRPLSGSLEITVAGPEGETTYARDVEVAASSRSVYRLVVPLGRVTAGFVEPGQDPVVVRADAEQPGAEFLIGFLGEPPAGLPPVRHEPTARTGAWVGLDEEWLSVSPHALEPLGALVAEMDALEALPEEAVRNLATAVAAGTDLFVVGQGPVSLGPLQADGPAWTVTGSEPAEVRPLGRGRIGDVAAMPGEGDSALWSTLLGPQGANGRGSEWDLTRAPYQFPRLLADEDAGVPAVPWLASFLVVYVLVVGPVNGIVLARLRRRELAWITVPVVTAIFTAAAFAGAVGGRPALGVGARLAYWVDGVGAEVAVVAVRNPTPGTREASLPGGGWTVQAFGNAGGATIEAGEDVRASIDLSALQLGGLVGTRPLPGTPPLELAAVAGPDEVQVTVRNTSGSPLSDVVVRAATTSTRVGNLAAGAEQTVTLDGERLRPVDPYRDLLNGLGAAPASLEALLRGSMLDGSPGLVWALGHGGPGLPLEAGGDAAEDEGTLLAVAVTPELPGDGRVGPFAVDRELVSATRQSYLPTPMSIEGPDEVVLRFRFPAGGQVDRLHQDLERGVGDVETLSLWDVPGRQWVPIGDAFGPDGAEPERFLSPLGEVHVRVSGQPGIFDFSARSVSGVEVPS